MVAANNEPACEQYVLCMTPLEDEGNQSSDSVIALLVCLLNTYELDAAQLACFVCDHAVVNVAIARRTSVSMIGCASHRLNLAAQLVLKPHHQHLDKVATLATRLSTSKNHHYLCERGAPMPVKRDATRWTSSYAAIGCLLEISSAFDRTDSHLLNAVPSAREEAELKALRFDGPRSKA